jgi:hypothetical protein
MSNARSAVGVASARAVYESARVTGVQVTFRHRLEDAVTLWACTVSSEGVQDGGGSSTSMVRARRIQLPVQAGFAVSTDNTEPVALGDKATIDSRPYRVIDFVKLSNGYVYELSLEQDKSLSIGGVV